MPPTSAPQRRANWHDAYDAQMGLWRWYRTDAGLKWLAEVYQAQVSEESLTPSMRVQVAGLFDAEHGKLLSLDPIFVSADMCELVDAARESFEPEPLLMTDLLTPRGFLWYERPLVIPTKRGEDLYVRAWSWAQQYQLTEGTDPVEFARRLNDPEMYAVHGSVISQGEQDQFVAEGLQEAVGVAVTLYADAPDYITLMGARGASPERMEFTRQATGTTPIVPVHLAPWWYGMSFDGNEFDLEGEPTGMSGWWQLTQTTLRLMQQKISHKGFQRPLRATRREGARLGFPAETEVVVVRLRRESADPDPGHESGEANYSHRFVVGGHWRNQWYPSEKIHRQIYIAPYVKGPEDKPLIVRPRRVFQWQR